MEEVVLGLDARVLDHRAGVGLQAGHGAADVAVDFDDLFDGGGFEEGGGHALFNADYDAVAGGYLGGVSLEAVEVGGGGGEEVPRWR